MSSYLNSLVIKSQHKPCSQLLLEEPNSCKNTQTVSKCVYFSFTDIMFLGYQMVRRFFDCLRVTFACVYVRFICVTYEATYSVDQNIIMWLFLLCRGSKTCMGQSQSQKQTKTPSCPSTSLSRGLYHRGVKLTVTVMARFVGRTVSVPS